MNTYEPGLSEVGLESWCDTTRTILLVEDDIDTSYGLRVYLEAHGYEAVTAPNGEEALALVKEVAPSLVILDLGLPGRDGFEVLRALRTAPETRETKVIVLSAWSPESHEELALDYGASMYMQKPEPGENLLEAIRFLLEG